MRHFATETLGVRLKADRTPVSEADEATESMLRQRLSIERPEDAIVGEEFGSAQGRRRWIIDPIDGTKNYIRGIPVYATLIALEEDGEPIVGVVSAPALGRRWWASRDGGAFCNDRRIRVSTIDDVAQAQLLYDGIADFDQAGLADQFLALARRMGRTRGFGDFWAHMLVAMGAAEIAVEPRVAHWDMAAVQIIVEEAGGRFSTLEGRRRADGGSGLTSNGRLHDLALGAFRR